MSLVQWRRLFYPQIALLLGLCAVFALYPRLDLTVSARFYHQGGGFFLRDHPFAQAFYRGIPLMTKIFSTVAAILIILNLKRKTLWLGLTPRVFLYLLLVLSLGPGLLVNGILKEHWGRARPVHITEFGGDKTYSDPFMPSDQCERNCSFISGHASTAFFPFAIALLVPGRRRMVAIGVAIVFGLGGSFGRIAQGGHFLSDVALGGLSTCLIATLLYRIFFLRSPPEASLP